MDSTLQGAPGLAAPAMRVCFGPNAPEEMAEFVTRAGIELVPPAYRTRASLYVDFVGARPTGMEVLSFDLSARGERAPRATADLATDKWQVAALLVISQALRLKPVLLSADAAMLSVLRSAVAASGSHVPTILEGEIGVGKYNVARLIHSASRSRGPLLSVSCASLQDVDIDNLAHAMRESKGAGGAIFLDEVGELTDAAQLKLLQLLQSLERTPLADAQSPAGATRFLAATNRALTTMAERGEFRGELFWRLNVLSLKLPPLRQRIGDVPLLARLFLRRANPRRMFMPMALRALGAYAFPGNVMELENLVTRLAIAPLATGNSLIDVADVRRHLMVVPAEGEQVSGWQSSREEARREMILKTIAAAGGNRAEAARRLGMTRRTLQYHITKAGLSRRAIRNKPVAPITSAPSPAGEPT
ncbi:MAG TPA: sigma 54-interacting transcriptional regulator [Candidatus Binataceae bacterium]|nr:sigma 54-interacting transcriptional regulator [Candidatus Binataceae bacterium]